jgi:hypothetical protein
MRRRSEIRELEKTTARLHSEFQREANRHEPERAVVFRGPLPPAIPLPDPEVIREQVRAQAAAEFATLREPVGDVEAGIAETTQHRFALVMLKLQRTLPAAVAELISEQVTAAMEYAKARDRRSIRASDNPPSGRLTDDHLGRALLYRWSRDVLRMNGRNAMNFVAKAERMTVPDDSQSNLDDSAVRASVAKGRRRFKKLWQRVTVTNAPEETSFADYFKLATFDVSVDHADHAEIMRLRRMLQKLMTATEHIIKQQ